ncbi:hypothetical protein CEXT_532781, partial [Caerostris extrusa]
QIEYPPIQSTKDFKVTSKSRQIFVKQGSCTSKELSIKECHLQAAFYVNNWRTIKGNCFQLALYGESIT